MISVIAVGATIPASGQVIFRSDTNLINILATVHDDRGRVVRGLTMNDFRLEEDGKPQIIHDFAAQSDLPLKLALLVDTSRSMMTVLDYEQQASIAFLKHALRPEQDRATVLTFDSEVQMLCPLDGSRKVLADAIHRIAPTPVRGPIPAAPGRSTALYDAIVEAAGQMRSVSGRKAIILLTDGLDVGSRHSLNEAVESALRSDTAVYTILVSPAMLARSSRYHPAPLLPSRNQAAIQKFKEMNLSRGRAALLQISKPTGGSSFEAALNRSVRSIYDAITDELRNQYRIGLSCDTERCRPGYHSLSLVALRSGQTVQSRQGFFAGDPARNSFADAHPAPEQEVPVDPLLLTAHRLALQQHESPVGFVADETVECHRMGTGDVPLFRGAAKVRFDQTSRIVERQMNSAGGQTLRMIGATSFGEFGVELSNVFLSVDLRQFEGSASGEFHFLVDERKSTWQVWDGQRWLAIAYVGALWINPADGTVRRLQRTSRSLRPELPVSLIQSDLEFGPATIGDQKVLMLPVRTLDRICEREADVCTEITSVVQSYSVR